MIQAELNDIVQLHRLWLQDDPSGSRAYLSRADLTGADLSGAKLSDAYLSRADLRGADLTGADLSGAKLSDANLSRAYLSRAYLSGADLSRADLRGADLTGAYLSGAYLRGADLHDAVLPHFGIIPESGGFSAYKKCCEGKIATLYIPARARRTSSLVGRKCRAEYAKVISIIDADGRPCDDAVSKHNVAIIYRVGEIVRPDGYDDDIRVECAQGIHFFITRKEAEEY